MKRPSSIQLLACLCATIALVPVYSASSLEGDRVAVIGKATSAETSDIQTRVENFARHIYPHGVPYLEAKRLGVEALPTLEELLRDTSQVEFWTTIVETMGFIGDSSSVKPLVDFVENRFEGDVNIREFSALLSVNGALGFIAGNGSSAAIEYLSRGCYVKTWMARDLKWHYGKYSGGKLALLLTRIAVNGLSCSGTDTAKSTLLELKEHPENESTASALSSNIREGLERIDRIQKEGADSVFGAQ